MTLAGRMRARGVTDGAEPTKTPFAPRRGTRRPVLRVAMTY